MEPLPCLNRGYSLVLQEESKAVFESVNLDESKSLVNSADSNKLPGKGKSPFSFGYKSRLFTFCGRHGHIVDTCYKKHGFQPNFGQKSSVNNAESLPGNVHVAENVEEPSKVQPSSGPTFIQEQFDRLLALIPPHYDKKLLANQVTSHASHGHSPFDPSSSGNLSSSFISSCYVKHNVSIPVSANFDSLLLDSGEW